jgi:hypothetical protein
MLRNPVAVEKLAYQEFAEIACGSLGFFSILSGQVGGDFGRRC